MSQALITISTLPFHLVNDLWRWRAFRLDPHRFLTSIDWDSYLTYFALFTYGSQQCQSYPFNSAASKLEKT